MKRTLFGLVASVAMMGTFIAAQDSQPPSPGQSSSPIAREQTRSADTSKSSDTTVTGCLVQGSSPNVFLLQDAKVAETGITSSASGYSSSSPRSSASASGMESGASASSTMSEHLAYRLETGAGTRDADFKTNLNHQVSITGTAEPRSSSSSSSSMSSSSSSSSMSGNASSSSQKIDEKTLPKLTAKSVLKLADTCSVAG